MQRVNIHIYMSNVPWKYKTCPPADHQVRMSNRYLLHVHIVLSGSMEGFPRSLQIDKRPPGFKETKERSAQF